MKDEDDDEDENEDKDEDEDEDEEKDKDKKNDKSALLARLLWPNFGLDINRNTFEKILQGKTTLGVERPF